MNKFNFVTRAFVLIALVAILASIVGGINGHVTWFHLGAIVFAFCISGLWITTIFRRNSAYANLDETADDAPEAFSTTVAETALKSMNRGTIPKQK